MRMDRYEDDNKNLDSKQTRTNKNQELYTDVYLNNVYVDINNLKEVMKNEEETMEKENIKIIKETKPLNYAYEDKVYDIRALIAEAIIKKGDDKIKRSIDTKVDDLEIASLIESINENKEEKRTADESKTQEEKEETEREIADDNNQNDDTNIEDGSENLLADLLPSDENTAIVPPLEEPLLNTEIIAKYEQEELEKEEQELEKTEQELRALAFGENDLELDDSFVEKDSKHKIVLIILGIVLFIAIIIGILLYTKII